MKIEWAKYLLETPEYETVTSNQDYIDSWKEYFNENKERFPKNELVLITGNMTIKNRIMVLEYALLNQTNKPIKEIERGVTLSLFGEE